MTEIIVTSFIALAAIAFLIFRARNTLSGKGSCSGCPGKTKGCEQSCPMVDKTNLETNDDT